MNKQSGLAPVVIVLFIAAAIGGYLVYSGKINLNKAQTPPSVTTQTETEESLNWQTYRNNVWQITYPPKWIIINESNSLVSFSDGKDVPRGPEVGNIYLQIAWGSSASYDEILNKPVGNVEKGAKLTITTEEKLTIDGYPAVRVIEETTPGAATEPSYTVAVYIKGPTNVRIAAQALKDKEGFNRNYLSVFNNILSGFTFLDKKDHEIVKDLTPSLNNSNSPDFHMRIRKIDGNYAFGGASISIDNPSGWGWMAVKINGKWQEVWTGNGDVGCSIYKKYSIPHDLTPFPCNETN